MANILSAQKKSRQDQKRRSRNASVKKAYKQKVKTFVKKPAKEKLAQAYSAIDKAAKKHVIHKNKAARLKSRLAKKKS
jgi:small subunit ribosomal protein S20